MLDHFTQYVGSAPDASPAVLCGIAHMQTSEGIWYPRGGTRAVPEALGKLAARARRRDPEGTRRAPHPDRGGGASPASRPTPASASALAAVVSNCRRRAHPPRAAGGAPRRAPLRAAAALRAGLLGRGALPRPRPRLPHLLHHNFVFSHDPEEEFDCDLPPGRAGAGPDLLRLRAPARTEPGVAPPGGEALYVLVHTPYLRPAPRLEADAPRLPPSILDKLARTAGLEDLEERIVFESALTPQDIHDRYHVLDGAIYGLASHGRMLGAFKPANRSRDVQGLYLAGGAAHPGPGHADGPDVRLDRRRRPGPATEPSRRVPARRARKRTSRARRFSEGHFDMDDHDPGGRGRPAEIPGSRLSCFQPSALLRALPRAAASMPSACRKCPAPDPVAIRASR